MLTRKPTGPRRWTISVAHSDATIKASLGQGKQATPLNGVIHADYAAAHKQLALTNSYIRTPQTSINLNGKISDRSQLQVAVRSNDLHELETLSAALQKPAPGTTRHRSRWDSTARRT